MEKRPLRDRVHGIVFQVSRYTEVFLAVIIIAVVGVLIFDLIYGLFQTPILEMAPDGFTKFLSDALGLVVGIEFVKMLCKHTPETLIEVLMFATARQMVVEHLETWQTLVGALAIAVLFAIRKFLFLKSRDEGQLTDKF